MTRLSRILGGPPLTLTVRGLPVPVELADVDQPGQLVGQLGAVSITRGRNADPDADVEAASCALTVTARALDAAGVGVPQLGDALVVELSGAAAAYFGASASARRRFTGSLTDAKALPETAAGGPAVYALTAVGPRARLGRVDIGDTPWPAELDGARAARIVADAAAQAADVVAGVHDAGTVTVLARDVDRRRALQLVDDLAASSSGLLVELRDGTLVWHDADRRRVVSPAVQLDAREVLAPAAWATSLSGVVNDLTVTYGPDAAEVQLVDQASVDGPAGRVTAKLDTELADAADARSLATAVIGRRSRPRWRIEQLGVDLVATLAPAKAAAVLALEPVGALVGVTGFPATGPFVTSRLWVEGSAEAITPDGWAVELAVTDYGLTGPAPLWGDVDPGIAWAQAPADLSWLGALSWWPEGAYTAQGRWLDVASSTRWRDVDAAQTWSAWTG